LSPAWSPDGGLIAFTSRRSGVDHLYLINADGTNERQITFGEGNHSLPAWKH
jgi:TolB protein